MKCDVGANKNASQAFSMPRLSSHFILYKISAFRLFRFTNQGLLSMIFGFQNAEAFSFFLSHSSLSFLFQDSYLSLFRIRFFVFLADLFFPVLFLRVHLISCHFLHVCLPTGSSPFTRFPWIRRVAVLLFCSSVAS